MGQYKLKIVTPAVDLIVGNHNVKSYCLMGLSTFHCIPIIIQAQNRYRISLDPGLSLQSCAEVHQ